jgi:ABC-type antimicrobial peptide transport system permease subunit
VRSPPARLLRGVLAEGVVMGAVGIVAGAAGGLVLARALASYVLGVQLPGAVPVVASAVVLLVAAVVASLVPTARAAGVDVMKALRAE